MMMRPRHYSVLNRSIARSITYSLRQYDRQNKYRSNKNIYVSNNTNSNNTTSDEDIVITFIIMFVVVGFIMFMAVLGNR